jgi:hypothetical protein
MLTVALLNGTVGHHSPFGKAWAYGQKEIGQEPYA